MPLFVVIYVGRMKTKTNIDFALLAQLDRVFGYEPKGQGFESLAARQQKRTPMGVLFCFIR